MPKDILVAYYSLSGRTRRLAEELAEALDAEIEEIKEARPRHGSWGVTRAVFENLLQREPKILAPRCDPRQFRLLVLGGPIWVGRLAAPVRSYARQYVGAHPRVALFCTQQGDDVEPAFRSLRRRMGWSKEPSFAVDARRQKPEAHSIELRQFLIALGRGQPARDSTTLSGAVL